jgi:hypothetical protein
MDQNVSSPYASSHSLHGTTHVNSEENISSSSGVPKSEKVMPTVAATLSPHSSPIARRNTLRERANSRAVTPRTDRAILPPAERDPTKTAFEQRQNYSHNCGSKYAPQITITTNLCLSYGSFDPSFDMGIRKGYAHRCGPIDPTHVGDSSTLLGLSRTRSATRAKFPRLGHRPGWRRTGGFCNRECHKLDNGKLLKSLAIGLSAHCLLDRNKKASRVGGGTVNASR